MQGEHRLSYRGMYYMYMCETLARCILGEDGRWFDRRGMIKMFFYHKGLNIITFFDKVPYHFANLILPNRISPGQVG